MNDLLQIARNDINTAELLFNNKIYSNAIYFYHQAVEKAVKYLGLRIGVIDTDDLRRKISHNPIKVFKILDEKENIFGGQGIDNFASIIKQLTDEQLVNNTLSEIEKSTRNLYDLDSNISSFQNFKNYIVDKNFEEKESLLSIEENAYYNKMASDFFNQLNVGATIMRMLFLNSCLCTKYSLDSYRYSNNEVGDPIEYFSINNPIILKLDIFIKSVKICLSQLNVIKLENEKYSQT
ncbi:HEPN domain-containing protein [Chryseobacterium sp. NKUCC03_KSP]|uniref:HEPN domain-containing protein n=1 Tax=Chryseobacterium sp. NKUCC03_KSP TaxID=2842125 RepID=UPI001C5B9B22|nr:HEPN domain-containing protein [Chryseobacterium sp. NKUCC03_KSP]MBW3523322.1 HEPN domain-containing protein [Chryseobacterium sp. NKUCC03_KSP]